jgi:ubiquinone/menaquinone biosynthesis C-methylase UbiE
MTAADFGCGSGGWVIPLATILKEGIVYAIDVQPQPLSVVRSRMERDRMYNIRIVEANVEKTGSKIGQERCDVVLLTNLLFQCEKPENVLKEAMRVLKQGGQLLVVDWYAHSPVAPTKTLSADDAASQIEKVGFSVKKSFQASEYHWGLIAQKP